jgi:hypothetical protein
MAAPAGQRLARAHAPSREAVRVEIGRLHQVRYAPCLKSKL